MQFSPKKREERSIFEHAVARGTKRVTRLTPRELTFSKHTAISSPAIDDDLAAHDEYEFWTFSIQASVNKLSSPGINSRLE